MQVTVNIEKRFAYVIIGALLIVAGIFAVNAFGTSNPSIMGHTPSEIAPGTFSGDVSSLFTFPGSIATGKDISVAGDVIAAQGINLGGVRKTAWPTAAQGCGWTGLKCACGADSSGNSQAYSIIGMECTNSVVTDLKYLAYHTGANAQCPAAANATWGCTGGYTKFP